MRVMMIPRMSETVDTSKDSVVREVDIDQISRVYEEEMMDIKDDVLRFDIPTEHSVKLGLRYYTYEGAYLYTNNEDTMLISSLELHASDPTDSIRVKPLYSKSKGNPKSCLLSEHEDDLWLAIPKHFSPFQQGEEINYEYVEQYEDGDDFMERHIRVTRK